MALLTYLIFLALQGLILGALARLALPGPDPMGIGMTILVGIGGALAAGLLGALVGVVPGFLMAFACTFAIVYFIRRSRGGSLTRPAPHDRFGGGGRGALGRRPQAPRSGSAFSPPGSFRSARRIGGAINPAARRPTPAGSPRLRSVTRVPSGASRHS